MNLIKLKFVKYELNDSPHSKNKNPWPESSSDQYLPVTAACRRSWCQFLRIDSATWSARWIPKAVFSVYLTDLLTVGETITNLIQYHCSSTLQNCYGLKYNLIRLIKQNRFPCVDILTSTGLDIIWTVLQSCITHRDTNYLRNEGFRGEQLRVILTAIVCSRGSSPSWHNSSIYDEWSHNNTLHRRNKPLQAI
jgi:hypothetical protein